LCKAEYDTPWREEHGPPSASPRGVVTFRKMPAWPFHPQGSARRSLQPENAGLVRLHERAETLLPHELKRSEVSRNISYRFLRMGGTGYQPVLVGNLPTRIERTLCWNEVVGPREVPPRSPAGLVARQHGQVARATLRLW